MYSRTAYFYPRPPRGGRPVQHRQTSTPHYFYPRPPRGGRLVRTDQTYQQGIISIHALREEGDPSKRLKFLRRTYFYPRPPRGGRLVRTDQTYQQGIISIHALREEGDKYFLAQSQQAQDFYPRPPRGGRRCVLTRDYAKNKFLSTPSARRATKFTLTPKTIYNKFLSTPSARRATVGLKLSECLIWISIHALREEGDFLSGSCFPSPGNFYPRPPRGGRRCVLTRDYAKNKFLSTPSARRATKFTLTPKTIYNKFLSTPSARRATVGLKLSECLIWISIHALREEGDFLSGSCFPSPGNFYPRPPRGGRPQTAGAAVPFEAISIHALREEGDLISLSIVMAAEIFLSTPSARRATQGFAVFFEGHLFLSTPSARRATIPPTTTAPDTTISIHALREEGDLHRLTMPFRLLRFLSTPSARRAT